MRRPAPPAGLCGGLRRRLRRHGAPALGGARRACVGVVLVGQEGRPGHYRRRHPGAPWPAGARQHGAHDGPGAPEARGGGGGRRGGPAPAHGVLARRDPRGGDRRPGRRAGAPGQRRLRRPPREGVRVRAPLPPRHRLRPARRLLARAPPRRVRAPLLAAPDRRLRRAARRDRAPDGRRHGGRGRRRRDDRDDGAAVPEARVAAQRDVVGVRPEVRAAGGQRGGGGAQVPGGRRVRPPRQAQLVRPPPLARPLRPAEDPGPVLCARPPGQPLRGPHHRRAPCPPRRRLRRRRHGLHRRAALPPGQRQALRRRHDRRPLGDDLSRYGHGGGSDGVGAGASGAAPGRAAPGPRGAGPGGRQQGRRRRDGVGHRLPRLPPGGHQGGAAPAPAGATPLLGAPRHVGRPRGRVPRTGRDHRHGEHVGHHPRPGRLVRPGRVQTGEVRGGGRRRRRRGRDVVPDHGVGPEARAVRVRQAELPRQVPRDDHRRVLARHPPARVRVAAGGGVRRLRRRRRRPVRSAEAVVRDGRPAGGEAGATSSRGVNDVVAPIIHVAHEGEASFVRSTTYLLARSNNNYLNVHGELCKKKVSTVTSAATSSVKKVSTVTSAAA